MHTKKIYWSSNQMIQNKIEEKPFAGFQLMPISLERKAIGDLDKKDREKIKYFLKLKDIADYLKIDQQKVVQANFHGRKLMGEYRVNRVNVFAQPTFRKNKTPQYFEKQETRLLNRIAELEKALEGLHRAI